MSLRELLAAATPGEWRIAPRINNMIDILHSDPTTKGKITLAICRVQARITWLDEASANADLIVAAHNALPALLDVLDAAKAMRGYVPVGNDNVGPMVTLSKVAQAALAFDAALARLDDMEKP
jgi:hypothetical protein